MRVAVSWSGGKDCCYAYYKALLEGFEVVCLINMVSSTGRVTAHGLDPKLIAAQSKALGIPLIQRETSWDGYEEDFKKVLVELKNKLEIKGVVFGDINVQEHLDWVNKVCSEVGLEAIEPLWGLSEEEVLKGFVGAGFDAIVVKAKTEIFGEEWVGRRVDGNFIKDLMELRKFKDFDLCGERGEYHTFVIDGPTFKMRIKILEAKRVLREGYWRNWILEITSYELEDKTS
ncbi:MAG: diphthine--ammonia ligase [Candidatus Nezhaarchaeales archaeon]